MSDYWCKNPSMSARTTLILVATGLVSCTTAAATRSTLQDQVRRANQSTVAVILSVEMPTPSGEQRTSIVAGSGVVVASRTVATCAHVLEEPSGLPPGARLGWAVVEDGRWSDGHQLMRYAKIEWIDRDRDIALLTIPDLAAPAALVATSDVQIGDDVFFIGHPGVQPNKNRAPPPAVGSGIVAAVDRAPLRDGGPEVRLLRLDGSVNLGNSGGGLFSRETGALIGIVTAKAGRLSNELRVVRDTKPTAAISIGGLDPVAALRQTLFEMEANLQLGIGFAIPLDEVMAQPGLRR